MCSSPAGWKRSTYSLYPIEHYAKSYRDAPLRYVPIFVKLKIEVPDSEIRHNE